MAYQRYAMQKDEIRILLDKIEENQQDSDDDAYTTWSYEVSRETIF